MNYSESEALPISNSYSNKRLYKLVYKLKEQNKNLFHENLKIRKQMLSLRAQMIHSSSLNKPHSMIGK